MAAENLCRLCVPPRTFKSRQGLAGHELLVHAAAPDGPGEELAALGERTEELVQRIEVLEDLVHRAYQSQDQQRAVLARATEVLEQIVQHLECSSEPSRGLEDDKVLLVLDYP